MDFIGWLGSFMLCLCGLPQAIKTVRTKSASDISLLFILMWLSGELAMIIYSVFKLHDAKLIFNYVGNLLCLIPIVYYKVQDLRHEKQKLSDKSSF